MPKEKVLVTGAGGFIGHHLVRFLKEKNHWVRGVDLKLPEYEASAADEFLQLDLREAENCEKAFDDMDEAYALAADMGGMGFIATHQAQILHNNSLINLHSLEAAKNNKLQRYLFASSACVYPEHIQRSEEARPLKESDAYPAAPQDTYGWEKLMTEILCEHYRKDYGLSTRVVRFHNIFGPLGTWQGGREKAPAAICRKVSLAKINGLDEIEIWGDGKQTRSFCYIDDCIEGIYRLMRSDFEQPINLGQDRLVSISELVEIISNIAGLTLKIKHIDGPVGVRGRNSDNSLLAETLNWSPSVSLEDGLKKTYDWIFSQAKKKRP